MGNLIRQEFQGDETSEFDILGLVDQTHAASAQFLEDAVVRNGLADHGRKDSGNGRDGCGAKSMSRIGALRVDGSIAVTESRATRKLAALPGFVPANGARGGHGMHSSYAFTLGKPIGRKLNVRPSLSLNKSSIDKSQDRTTLFAVDDDDGNVGSRIDTSRDFQIAC